MRNEQDEIAQFPSPEGTTINPKAVALVGVGVFLAMIIWMKSTGRKPILWR